MSFAAIDILFAALIVIFTVRCALRGFVGELFSVASLALGLLAALYFYRNGALFIREKFMPGLKIIPEIAAFIAIFLIVFICIKIIEGMLREIIEGIRLGRADRFLGIFFGLAEGIIVVSLILFVLSIQPLFESAPILEKSFFGNLLLPFITGGKFPGGGNPEAALRITNRGGFRV
ncbi:MAG: CvpA family protein [Treponema sp.]|jgi:membrane protein required for colicin V production|nr:CvpA family protein [Treponema sp.]